MDCNGIDEDAPCTCGVQEQPMTAGAELALDSKGRPSENGACEAMPLQDGHWPSSCASDGSRLSPSASFDRDLAGLALCSRVDDCGESTEAKDEVFKAGASSDSGSDNGGQSHDSIRSTGQGCPAARDAATTESSRPDRRPQPPKTRKGRATGSTATSAPQPPAGKVCDLIVDMDAASAAVSAALTGMMPGGPPPPPPTRGTIPSPGAADTALLMARYGSVVPPPPPPRRSLSHHATSFPLPPAAFTNSAADAVSAGDLYGAGMMSALTLCPGPRMHQLSIQQQPPPPPPPPRQVMRAMSQGASMAFLQQTAAMPSSSGSPINTATSTTASSRCTARVVSVLGVSAAAAKWNAVAASMTRGSAGMGTSTGNSGYGVAFGEMPQSPYLLGFPSSDLPPLPPRWRNSISGPLGGEPVAEEQQRSMGRLRVSMSGVSSDLHPYMAAGNTPGIFPFMAPPQPTHFPHPGAPSPTLQQLQQRQRQQLEQQQQQQQLDRRLPYFDPLFPLLSPSSHGQQHQRHNHNNHDHNNCPQQPQSQLQDYSTAHLSPNQPQPQLKNQTQPSQSQANGNTHTPNRLIALMQNPSGIPSVELSGPLLPPHQLLTTSPGAPSTLQAASAPSAASPPDNWNTLHTIPHPQHHPGELQQILQGALWDLDVQKGTDDIHLDEANVVPVSVRAAAASSGLLLGAATWPLEGNAAVSAAGEEYGYEYDFQDQQQHQLLLPQRQPQNQASLLLPDPFTRQRQQHHLQYQQQHHYQQQQRWLVGPVPQEQQQQQQEEEMGHRSHHHHHHHHQVSEHPPSPQHNNAVAIGSITVVDTIGGGRGGEVVSERGDAQADRRSSSGGARRSTGATGDPQEGFQIYGVGVVREGGIENTSTTAATSNELSVQAVATGQMSALEVDGTWMSDNGSGGGVCDGELGGRHLVRSVSAPANRAAEECRLLTAAFASFKNAIGSDANHCDPCGSGSHTMGRLGARAPDAGALAAAAFLEEETNLFGSSNATTAAAAALGGWGGANSGGGGDLSGSVGSSAALASLLDSYSAARSSMTLSPLLDPRTSNGSLDLTNLSLSLHPSPRTSPANPLALKREVVVAAGMSGGGGGASGPGLSGGSACFDEKTVSLSASPHDLVGGAVGTGIGLEIGSATNANTDTSGHFTSYGRYWDWATVAGGDVTLESVNGSLSGRQSFSSGYTMAPTQRAVPHTQHSLHHQPQQQKQLGRAQLLNPTMLSSFAAGSSTALTTGTTKTTAAAGAAAASWTSPVDPLNLMTWDPETLQAAMRLLQVTGSRVGG